MLVAVPIKNQRTERGRDGRPPEDGNMDCVPTSLAAMAQAITGQPLAGDDLHDEVYGQGYIGMQDPARYVAALRALGVGMTPYEGDAAHLVARAVSELKLGRPSLLSIPSDWNDQPPHSPYAHMVAACDVTPGGSLVAMNPWTASYQTQSLAWWQERIARCSYRGIWVLERVPIMPVPKGWHDTANGDRAVEGALIAPNSVRVVRGMRDHILAAADWNPVLVPLAPEYGTGPGKVRQDLGLSLEWDAAAPDHIDEVPGRTVTVNATPSQFELDEAAKARALDAVFALYKNIAGK